MRRPAPWSAHRRRGLAASRPALAASLDSVPVGDPSRPRLVVGLSEVERERHVLEYVGRIASRTSAEIDVVHVREWAGPVARVAKSRRESVVEVEAALFLLRMAGVEANGHVERGPVTLTPWLLLEHARSADVIVMSGPRGGRFTRLTGGGVREQVMRHASAPVVLVPA